MALRGKIRYDPDDSLSLGLVMLTICLAGLLLGTLEKFDNFMNVGGFLCGSLHAFACTEWHSHANPSDSDGAQSVFCRRRCAKCWFSLAGRACAAVLFMFLFVGGFCMFYLDIVCVNNLCQAMKKMNDSLFEG
eukprot:Rmarinus@m.5397